MKQIIYMASPEDSFLITDKEFKEAVTRWRENKLYWCKRIEALLSRRFLIAETPRAHLGRKIYIDGYDSRCSNEYREIFFEDGKWKMFDGWGGLDALPFEDYKTKDSKLYEDWKKRILSEMIPIDDFYAYGGKKAYSEAGSKKQFYLNAGVLEVEEKKVVLF